MADKKKKEKDILIQTIDIRQVQRSSIDIQDWRTAITSAESVINPTRRLLYDLYAEMLLDGRLASVIDKRRNAILNTTLQFVQDGEVDEAMQDVIDTQEFEDLLKHLIDAKFFGYTLVQLDFQDEKIVPTLIDRRHVKPELGLVVRNPGDMAGIKYVEPPYDRYVLSAGDKKDLGLILSACQYVIYKRGGFGDWAQFAELFGMPFRKGKYPDYDTNARDTLTKALDEAGSAAYVVIPEGTDIEFIQNFANASSNMLYKDLINACNDEITIRILGQTLTTQQGDKGARALGDVHSDVEASIFEADKRYIEKLLNHRLKPLLELHGYKVNGHFTFSSEEMFSKTEQLEMDMKIKASGVPVSDDYFYETYNIPKPDDYDAITEERTAMRKLMQAPGKDDDEPQNLLQKFTALFSH